MPESSIVYYFCNNQDYNEKILESLFVHSLDASGDSYGSDSKMSSIVIEKKFVFLFLAILILL